MTAKWGEITAGEIVAPIKGTLISGREDMVLTGISTDSRGILPGQLFLALRGDRYDGHDFVDKAVDKGASCVIAEKGCFKAGTIIGPAVIEIKDGLKALGDLAAWWRQQHDVRVAAITGSVGKTTTKEMTAGILELGARTLKNMGNFNNLIGLPLTILRLQQEDRNAVLEMGMNQPGEIDRLTEIAEPDIGLITNVARVHLEGLSDIAGVAKAKMELMERISPEGLMILNGDDKELMRAASRFNREVVTYGLGSDNEIRAARIRQLGNEGLSFELHYHGDSHPIRLRVPGKPNLLSALAASAIAICMDEPISRISTGLNSFKGIRGRFMLTPLPGDIILVDDTYNSNPASLKAAVDSVKDLAEGKRRLIVGLGEMMELGDETVLSHREAGGMIADLGVSYFLAIGEHARDMVTGALDNGLPPEKVMIVGSQDEMCRKIRDVIREGDLIFLKGSRMMGLEKVSEGLKEEMVKGGNHRAQTKKDNGSG